MNGDILILGGKVRWLMFYSIWCDFIFWNNGSHKGLLWLSWYKSMSNGHRSTGFLSTQDCSRVHCKLQGLARIIISMKYKSAMITASSEQRRYGIIEWKLFERLTFSRIGNSATQ